MAIGLTDSKIKNIKIPPEKKVIRISDAYSKGLYLEAQESSKLDSKKVNKRWLFRRGSWYGIGTYPDVSLSMARSIAQEYRSVKAKGQDLKIYINNKKIQKSNDYSFQSVSTDWYKMKEEHWSVNTRKRNSCTLNLLNNYFAKII